MVTVPPYADDGLPIKAKLGRPAKPRMTEHELAICAGIAMLGKTYRSPAGQEHSLGAMARIISHERKAHLAIDPRTREARTVSQRWIHNQLLARGIAGKKGLRAKVEAGQIQPLSVRKSETAGDWGPRITRASSPGMAEGETGGPGPSEPGPPAKTVAAQAEGTGAKL